MRGLPVGQPPGFIPMRPDLAAPAGLTLAPGEGVFHVAVSSSDEQPVVQFAKIRPDATYTSVLEDVVWIDQKRTSYVLHPGHEGGVNKKVPVPNQIDADAKPNLIALYNGGFKIDESHGGYYDHGVTVAPLVNGAASEVIFKDGHLAVGTWGRDFSFSKDTDIVSVRQNLRLMVDGGQVVPYIGDAGNWGRSDHGSAAVWRSGVGVTAQGDVVYVAGNDLTAPSLANLLKLAGAEYAMQLDINAAGHQPALGRLPVLPEPRWQPRHLEDVQGLPAGPHQVLLRLHEGLHEINPRATCVVTDRQHIAGGPRDQSERSAPVRARSYVLYNDPSSQESMLAFVFSQTAGPYRMDANCRKMRGLAL